MQAKLAGDLKTNGINTALSSLFNSTQEEALALVIGTDVKVKKGGWSA
jgi:hypothetical protein